MDRILIILLYILLFLVMYIDINKKYIPNILNFAIQFDNLAHYNCYGYPLKKPTRFKSNINLHLKHDRQSKPLQQWGDFAKSYNERSNIPIELIKDIYQVTQQYLSKQS